MKVVDLASRKLRDATWWQGLAVCTACRSSFIVVVPEPCGPAEQAAMVCDGCSTAGGILIPDYCLQDAVVVYDDGVHPRVVPEE